MYSRFACKSLAYASDLQANLEDIMPVNFYDVCKMNRKQCMCVHITIKITHNHKTTISEKCIPVIFLFRQFKHKEYNVCRRRKHVFLTIMINLLNCIYQGDLNIYRCMLDVRKIRTKKYGARWFSFAAATLWNVIQNIELLENLEEMFPRYYMISDVLIKADSNLQPHNGV